jgi:hypothetical protein
VLLEFEGFVASEEVICVEEPRHFLFLVWIPSPHETLQGVNGVQGPQKLSKETFFANFFYIFLKGYLLIN